MNWQPTTKTEKTFEVLLALDGFDLKLVSVSTHGEHYGYHEGQFEEVFIVAYEYAGPPPRGRVLVVRPCKKHIRVYLQNQAWSLYDLRTCAE